MIHKHQDNGAVTGCFWPAMVSPNAYIARLGGYRTILVGFAVVLMSGLLILVNSHLRAAHVYNRRTEM
eukprot:scaffold7805_cov153-Amphora_coffeaeformis.AAC.4